MAQMMEPSKNDWATQVLKDIVDINIEMELSQIEQIKTETFEEIVKNKVKTFAFNYLRDKKEKNKTVKHIQHKSFKMADYLAEN